MDDLLPATQGDRTQQQRVSELTLRALKEISPSLPAETKDSVSLKKALQGDGDWKTTKEILGCMVNTEDGTLRLPPPSARRSSEPSLAFLPRNVEFPQKSSSA